MRITLHKYIFNEIWPTFVTVLMVFIFLGISKDMLELSDFIINYGGRLTQVLMLILYLLPDILLFSLPAATLMAVFVAFLRLSSSNEILAMKSSGISLFQMLPTVLLFSFASCLIAIYLGAFGVPWGNASFKNLGIQIAQSGAKLRIKERVFSQAIDNLTFYVNRISTSDHIMKDVFVSDKRDPRNTKTIVAKEAQILSDPKSRTITLLFRNCTISHVDEDLRSTSAKMDSYRLTMGIDDMMNDPAPRDKDPKEMTLGELTDYIKHGAKGGTEYNIALTELLEKFSIPFAVFLMGVIGVPLGAQLKSGGRTVGIVIGLIVFLIHYIFFAFAKNLCEIGSVSPLIGVWIPDLFLLIASLYIWHRAAKERPIQVLERMRLKWENRRLNSYGM
jgi:lipopolysaccharide export system permease protein